jgi:hypothetical protein
LPSRQAFLRWQDKAANQKFFAGELQFMKDARHPAGGRHHPQGPEDLNVKLRRQLHQVNRKKNAPCGRCATPVVTPKKQPKATRAPSLGWSL